MASEYWYAVPTPLKGVAPGDNAFEIFDLEPVKVAGKLITPKRIDEVISAWAAAIENIEVMSHVSQLFSHILHPEELGDGNLPTPTDGSKKFLDEVGVELPRLEIAAFGLNCLRFAKANTFGNDFDLEIFGEVQTTKHSANFPHRDGIPAPETKAPSAIQVLGFALVHSHDGSTQALPNYSGADYVLPGRLRAGEEPMTLEPGTETWYKTGQFARFTNPIPTNGIGAKRYQVVVWDKVQKPPHMAKDRKLLLGVTATKIQPLEQIVPVSLDLAKKVERGTGRSLQSGSIQPFRRR